MNIKEEIVSKFVQLEYSWKEYDGKKWFTEMLIVNLDYVISADVQSHHIKLINQSLWLTDRGWGVLMEAISPPTPEHKVKGVRDNE